MLFRKDIEPRCLYCKYGTSIGEDSIACVKKGIMTGGDHCRGFAYDPFKRVPPAQAVPDFSKLKDEDFSL